MLKDREEIKSWLDKYYITNYTINDDLTVDVKGSVHLNSFALTEIPVQFNIVNGSFNCSFNSLTSLAGSPKIVKGCFHCYWNKLTSLKYLPEIHGKLLCDKNLYKTKEYKIYEISKKLREMV